MAVKMKGEIKNGREYEFKKLVYNNGFTGSDINFGRMKGLSSKKVIVKKTVNSSV